MKRALERLAGRTLRLAVVPVAALAGWLGAGHPAVAQQPRNWALGMQDAHSPIMAQMTDFHDVMLVVIYAIALLVLGLMLYAVWRFREARNPTPSRTTHNTIVETLWTTVPILLLILIGILSLPLLYNTDRTVDADMTIKVIGNQWFWSYAYPDHGDFTFDAFMVPEGELQPGQPRLLATDEDVVVPVGTKIRLLVTGSDVLHAWAMPALGVKTDAVPGRINETWFQVDTPGIYYGQCSELCGTRHSFMPIAVRAVSKAEFEVWVKDAQQRFAAADDAVGPRPMQTVRAAAPASPAREN